MNVNDMNVTALRKLASELQIPGRSKMNADELREAISAINRPTSVIDNDNETGTETGTELAAIDELNNNHDHANSSVNEIPLGRIKNAHKVPARRAKNKTARKSRRKNRVRA